jgi:hypothetical protein
VYVRDFFLFFIFLSSFLLSLYLTFGDREKEERKKEKEKRKRKTHTNTTASETYTLIFIHLFQLSNLIRQQFYIK